MGAATMVMVNMSAVGVIMAERMSRRIMAWRR